LTASPAQAAVDCSTPTLINGSFEDFTLATPPYSSGTPGTVVGGWMNDWGTPDQFLFLDLDLPPQALAGWETTNSENLVELQRQVAGYEQDGTQTGAGYFDNYAVQPAEGDVWGELNSTEDAALYQDIALTAGMEYTWSIKHHGRVLGSTATDEMAVLVGLALGAPGSLVAQTDIRKYAPTNADLFSGEPTYGDDFTNVTQILGSLEDGWQMFRGTYTPSTTGTYRFQFQALDGFAQSVSNLLDDIQFEPTECLSVQSGAPVSSNLPDTGMNGATVASIAGIGSLLIAAGAIAVIRRRRSNA
jgi:LPXTG-motif cell wall-anchored protein